MVLTIVTTQHIKSAREWSPSAPTIPAANKFFIAPRNITAHSTILPTDTPRKSVDLTFRNSLILKPSGKDKLTEYSFLDVQVNKNNRVSGEFANTGGASAKS